MAGRVDIDPRYLSYSKDEVQALLDAVPGKLNNVTEEEFNQIFYGDSSSSASV